MNRFDFYESYKKTGLISSQWAYNSLFMLSLSIENLVLLNLIFGVFSFIIGIKNFKNLGKNFEKVF